jgi:predicted acylesterase/phospholipase RssA
MHIKHIVLSGGSYHGIQLLGALYEAEEKLLQFKNIVSVYGTSAGSIVLAIWLLRIEKKIVYDFIIERPWQKTYLLDSNIIANLLTKKGICDKNIINEILIPLLKSKLLDPDITLKRFYEVTNVDFHIIATCVNTMEPIDFSHTSHPDLSLLDAIYMSSSIPFLFQPRYYNGSFIIDGGLSLHFPIQPCLASGAKKENILGINITKKTPFLSTEETALTGLMFQILNNITRRLSRLVIVDIPYLITMVLQADMNDFPGVITDKDVRVRLLKCGEKYIDNFLQCGVQELV